MKSPTLSIDALKKVVAALPEDNLAASRRAALAQLRQDGLPGSREENWKYTDLSGAVRYIKQEAQFNDIAQQFNDRFADSSEVKISDEVLRKSVKEISSLPSSELSSCILSIVSSGNPKMKLPITSIPAS